MILLRDDWSDEGTYGYLVYGNEFVHTLELPWRDNQPNASCIPAGRYTVRMRHSPKYGQVYHVQSVPNRTHILLHHGNYAGDRVLNYRTHSAGCILFGSRRGRLHGQRAVLASRIARRKFESAMKWEPFQLEVVNA